MTANAAGANGALIETRGVTRILPGIVPTTLVHDIDLVIGGNEFLAVTGPSGSGKSSLLYLLGLLDLPTAGARSRAFCGSDKFTPCNDPNGNGNFRDGSAELPSLAGGRLIRRSA